MGRHLRVLGSLLAVVVLAAACGLGPADEPLVGADADDCPDVVTASPMYGSERPDYGAELKSTTANVRLHDVDAAEFDAVFFIGGDNYDLIVKHAPLIVDTRNATVGVKAGREKICKA